MRTLMLCLLVLEFASTTVAQLSVVSLERLPLDPARQWSQVRFSPDGSRIYLTTSDYRGIWEFELASGLQRQITDDPGSGYAFSVSDDGSLLAYRRLIGAQGVRLQHQELVLRRLDQPSVEVVASERKLSVPVFDGNRIVYLGQPSIEKTGASGASMSVTLLGIEETKIALLVNGTKLLLDPLGTGRYIWPSLSPDRTHLATVQMERGALVTEVDGSRPVLLGKCNTPSWTHDGRWIIGMDDRDDGYQVTESDLVFVSPDGARRGRLTTSDDLKEMYPACSPVDNRIAFSTLSGAVYMLRYRENGR